MFDFGSSSRRWCLRGSMFQFSSLLLAGALCIVTTAKAGPFGNLFIPDSEYRAVERRALEGSAEDAFRMASHFEAGFQYDKAIFWGTIAAENGSQVGAFNLGYRLAQSPDPKQRIRARFWLQKVIDHGGDTARMARNRLSEMDRNERLGKEGAVVFPERYPKW